MTESCKAHKDKKCRNFGCLREDMWTLPSEVRVWLTEYLSCWGSFVRAKHITDWWSLSWGQHASLLHIHTVPYIDTHSDIPDHNNMKPTKRPPPVSFISVWIQAENIYLPVRHKVCPAKHQQNDLCRLQLGQLAVFKMNINARTAEPLPNFFRNLVFFFLSWCLFPLCFLKSNQHMVAWLWEWGQMFWQLNRDHVHARARNICAHYHR